MQREKWRRGDELVQGRSEVAPAKEQEEKGWDSWRPDTPTHNVDTLLSVPATHDLLLGRRKLRTALLC